MKEIELITRIESLSYKELNEVERQVVDAALSMTKKSYAPYSHFCVGAAILLSNGEIATGANQENAAYPSGTCAERSACFWAGANYPEASFELMAIAARGTDGRIVPTPIAPCGACRQSLLEYENRAGHNVPLLLVGETEIYRLPSFRSTLPLAFSEF